jgi:general secretion pathway protein M
MSAMNTTNVVNTLRLWWTERPAREQNLLRGAALLVGAALLWSVALAPALRTLRSFEASRNTQEVQLQSMLRLQAQAQALQSQPKLSQVAATQALQASVQQAFGTSATLSVNAGNATVTLSGVRPDALAQWLASARTNAHSAPVQARIARAANGWSGTLQMALPAN